MKILTPNEKQELESLVDRVGLVQVAEALADICIEKVEHLQSNWQETNSDQVKVWKRNGHRLSVFAANLWRQAWERTT